MQSHKKNLFRVSETRQPSADSPTFGKSDRFSGNLESVVRTFCEVLVKQKNKIYLSELLIGGLLLLTVRFSCISARRHLLNKLTGNC